MDGKLKVITPVSGEPISVDDVKDQLRIDIANEDDYIADLIFAVREYAESYTGRALATQTLEILLDGFPDLDFIEIQSPPLQSVTSVKYKDSTGAEITMAATTDYLVDTEQEPGRIVLPLFKAWPAVTLYPVNPIRIRYVAGYDGATLKIPYGLKAALLLHVGLLYKYRDDEIPPGAMDTVKRLYNMYRLRWL